MKSQVNIVEAGALQKSRVGRGILCWLLLLRITKLSVATFEQFQK